MFLLPAWTFGRPLAVDVTVSNPSQGIVANQARVGTTASERAALAKVDEKKTASTKLLAWPELLIFCLWLFVPSAAGCPQQTILLTSWQGAWPNAPASQSPLQQTSCGSKCPQPCGEAMRGLSFVMLRQAGWMVSGRQQLCMMPGQGLE